MPRCLELMQLILVPIRSREMVRDVNAGYTRSNRCNPPEQNINAAVAYRNFGRAKILSLTSSRADSKVYPVGYGI